MADGRTRPKEFLNLAHVLVAKVSDDPIGQVLRHVAYLLGVASDDVQASRETMLKVARNGFDIETHYVEFIRRARFHVGVCVKQGLPIPDYLGAYVSRKSVDKYQTEEFNLTDTDLVHAKNKLLLHPEERGFGIICDGELCMHRVEELAPENIVPLLDPTMGTGRVGMNAVCYYPALTYWGIERDLDTYRVALLNGLVLAPFCRGGLGGRQVSRWNVLWADSLVIDVRDTRNWENGMNRWDPPDWQVYSRAQGSTWADLQRVLEVGNVDSKGGARKGGTNMGTVANGLPQSRFPGALPIPQSQ